MNQNNACKWFIYNALAYIGTPYKWGGDDPSGFDCSGFVIECLKTVGLCRKQDDFTADSLLQYFSNKERLSNPRKGTLLFYLNEKKIVYHVVICLDEAFQIGASGGNSKTNSKQKAWDENAFIKIRPIKFNPKRMIVINIFN